MVIQNFVYLMFFGRALQNWYFDLESARHRLFI